MKKGRNQQEDGKNGQDLWQNVTRGMKAYAPLKNSVPRLQSGSPENPSVRKTTPLPPRPAPPKPEGFDRATEKKLRRGQLSLEGRLDLHGMTQEEAFSALYKFVLSAAARGKRTVLIITGKGRNREGVLKKMLPLWLEDAELAGYVLALTPAQPKDGGGGAFYLRLRKPASG